MSTLCRCNFSGRKQSFSDLQQKVSGLLDMYQMTYLLFLMLLGVEGYLFKINILRFFLLLGKYTSINLTDLFTRIYVFSCLHPHDKYRLH